MDQESFGFFFTLTGLAIAVIAFAGLHNVNSNPEEYGDKENQRLNLPRNLSQEECDAYNRSRPFFSSIPRAYTNRAHARRAAFVYSIILILSLLLLYGYWSKEILTFCTKLAQLRLSQSQMIFIQDRPFTHAPFVQDLS